MTATCDWGRGWKSQLGHPLSMQSFWGKSKALCEIMNCQIEQVDPEIVDFEKAYFGDGKRSVHYLSLASIRKVMDLANQFKFVPADDERSKFTFKLALDEIAPSSD